MTGQDGASLALRYIACYAAWIGMCALAGVIAFQVVEAVPEIGLRLRANPWVARGARQLSLPVLGLAWLVLIFWLEHHLRTGVQRGKLLRRTLQTLIPLAATLAVVMGGRALL
jgi:hypothetical protein